MTDPRIYTDKGLDQSMSDGDRAAKFLTGFTDYYTCNATSGDVDVPSGETTWWQNCRAIAVDSTGIVKIDYRDAGGVTKTEVMVLNSGVWYPIRNVIKVYRYYVGTTAITGEVYSEAGALVNGIKLRR